MWIQETLYDGYKATMKMAFCRVLRYCDNFCGILMFKKKYGIFSWKTHYVKEMLKWTQK